MATAVVDVIADASFIGKRGFEGGEKIARPLGDKLLYLVQFNGKWE